MTISSVPTPRVISACLYDRKRKRILKPVSVLAETGFNDLILYKSAYFVYNDINIVSIYINV